VCLIHVPQDSEKCELGTELSVPLKVGNFFTSSVWLMKEKSFQSSSTWNAHIIIKRIICEVLSPFAKCESGKD
jgi:hypothetical protein